MPLFDYECKKCGNVQEVQHKIAEKNKNYCSKCNASPSKLCKLLSPLRAAHHSWGSWKIGLGKS